MNSNTIHILILLAGAIVLKIILRRYTAGFRGSKRQLAGEKEVASSLGVGCLAGLASTTLVVYSLIWVIEPGWTSWSQLGSPRAWGTAIPGFVILASAIGLYFASRLSLGLNFVSGIGLTQGHTLVTKGPYRYVRNPIYSAYALAVVGLALYTLSVVPVTAFAVFTWCVMQRVPHEEQLLARQFPDDWPTYEARTGRYWPKFRIRRS